MKPTTSLVPPRLQVDKNNPFHGDLFKRKELAEQLTGYLDRLRDGTVVAIDAPWGEGKSWFGLHWAASLKSQDYRVIYLDAFQQDYVEDPFLLIASEITEALAEDATHSQALKEKAASVMKAMLPVATKALLNIAGRLTLGAADLSKDITEAIQSAGDSASDATQKWLEEKIEAHGQEKASLESFRNALQEFCASQEKPVVFFIDELDRCRPTFAVRLIERLKHFFDVPNLIFVLLLNRQQLEKAIKGVYGSDTDASSYLSKFVHLFLRLPKKADASNDQSNANWTYLWELTKHYKLNNDNSRTLESFIASFSVIASTMGMSLRDMEKGMALLALEGVSNSTPYLSWLIALKLKHPDLFAGLLKEDINAHQAAFNILGSMQVSDNYIFWVRSYFLALHRLSGFGKDSLSEQHTIDLDQFKPTGFYHSNSPLYFWLKRLDIAIQD